jgi:hypothetical protein
MRTPLLRLVPALALALVACDSTPPSIATGVTVDPGSIGFDAVGATRVVRATVVDQRGKVMSGAAVSWSSSSAAVSIAPAGGDSALITAAGNGAATITATAGQASGSVVAEVVQIATSSEKTGGDAQSGPAGQALGEPLRVRVRDRLNQPVAGATVAFAVISGGGTLSAYAVPTGPDGVAQTTWTLGTTVSFPPQLAAATVGTLGTQQFTATAEPGPAATAAASEGDNQSALPGASVQIAPRVVVLDAYGNGVPGVAVQFSVTQGGGSVAGGSQTTGALGAAAVLSWTLGNAVGPNALTASFPGTSVSPVVFTAHAGASGTVVAVAGDNQAAMSGTAVPTRPRVIVRDDAGNPLPGVSVTFAVTEGGGTVSGGTATTNASGVAEVGSWTLGTTAAPNRLTATAAGFVAAPAVFRAAGCSGGGGSGYEMTLCFLTPVSESQRAAYASAATRWSGIITGDLPGLTGSVPAGSCGTGSPSLTNFAFDDLVIFASIENIDGPGGILGQAGWCYRRTAGLPVLGLMRFDAADVANLEASGRFVDVVLHEMGHVLGLSSSIWIPFGLLHDASSEGNVLDTYFSGARAIAAFDAIGGSSYTGGRKVPVENQYGAGTRNSHWRESVLANELMTGFLNQGSNPLSILTVRALEDMGYVVDASRADPFSVVVSLRADRSENVIHLHDDEWQGPRYTIDRSGRRTLLPR